MGRWAAALTLGLAAGCSRGAQVPAPAESGAEQAAVNAPLLMLIATAPGKVVHMGLRRYVAHWNDGVQSHALEYTEEVATDGTGKFAVTPKTLVEPQLPPPETSLFFLTQELREGMMFRARDFGVRDLDLFAANYSLVDTGLASQVAGVTCARVLVSKRVSPDRRYVLDVHTATGLVLSAREELLDGTLIARTVYESIDFTPDLSTVSWYVPINSELPLVSGSPEAVTSLGFQPRTPKLLPTGWQQIGLAKLVDPTTQQVWARLTYSDGVEQIFFVVAKGDAPKHQPKNPPPGTPPSHPDRVRKLAVGSWTLLEADLAAGRVLVLGRAPDGVLQDLIQSAFF